MVLLKSKSSGRLFVTSEFRFLLRRPESSSISSISMEMAQLTIMSS
jgi:hypothetical protein